MRVRVRVLAARRRLVGYAAALAGVALVSLFIGFVLGQVSLANVSTLYLFAVLATAVAFGHGPAVFRRLVLRPAAAPVHRRRPRGVAGAAVLPADGDRDRPTGRPPARA